MSYFDNSATTPITNEVLDAMLPYLKEEFGNPSGKFYEKAVRAKEAVDEARKSVSDLVQCDPDEIIFTSGATEGNNMVIKGIAELYENTNRPIVTSKAEHPSVIEPCEYLESKGFPVLFLETDQFARVSAADIQVQVDSMNNKPSLISIIWGNNELGSLNDVEKIAAYCEAKEIMLHVDATQVTGKVPINLQEIQGIRFLTFSAHKLHGPKGIGACVIRKENKTIKTKLPPLIHGGSQEQGYRSGTLAVHNIVGFGKAAELALKALPETRAHLIELENDLKQILKEQFGDKISFNQDEQEKIPGIISVQFHGVNNELLLKKLSPFMALSTGSACSSGKPSHVLSSSGRSRKEIQQTVRISLSRMNTKEELAIFKEIS